jgi:mannitol-1-phosphate/altronate dehydrogenase
MVDLIRDALILSNASYSTSYDRSQLETGIVHIGPGNFHLGHMAYLTHQLMEKGNAADLQWGITGVSLNTSERSEKLNPQDGLYTVVEQNGEQDSLTIVGSVRNVLFAPENPQAVIDQMAQPGVKIVSLAMTENGYYLKPDGSLNVEHADIQNDLRADMPKTALGYIAHAFAARHEQGLPGFTVQSCDNIVHNGDYTRGAVLKFIELWRPELVEAASQELAFPNSMVDRIVPKTTAELVASVARQSGYQDALPVPAEPMPNIPWVIEDNFVAGRPNWEEVGATFAEDVTPYENMKLRLLNASHAAIASLGDMMGLTYIYETMQNPLLNPFMQRLMKEESEPTLVPVPNVDFSDYEAELVTRFANTAVKDTVQRVATDAPLNTLLNAIKDQLQTENPQIDLLSLATAGWIYRMGANANEMGGAIEIKHPMAREIKDAVQSGGALATMDIHQVFGDVGQDVRVRSSVVRHYHDLTTMGAANTLKRALQLSGSTPRPRP